MLARLRRLRGTAFDVFGRTAERRMERRSIADYETMVRELAAGSAPTSTRSRSRSPPSWKMRGFGHIKLRNVEKAKAREAELLALLRNKDSQVSASLIRAAVRHFRRKRRRRRAGGVGLRHGRRQRVAPGAIA